MKGESEERKAEPEADRPEIASGNAEGNAERGICLRVRRGERLRRDKGDEGAAVDRSVQWFRWRETRSCRFACHTSQVTRHCELGG